MRFHNELQSELEMRFHNELQMSLICFFHKQISGEMRFDNRELFLKASAMIPNLLLTAYFRKESEVYFPRLRVSG
jgi:hypothetical protein